MIALTGILTVRNWKDEQEKLHSLSEVVAENIYFCGDKQKNDADPTKDIPDGFSQLTNDDIPF